MGIRRHAFVELLGASLLTASVAAAADAGGAGNGFAFLEEIPLTCVTKAPRPTSPVVAATDGRWVLSLDGAPGKMLFEPAAFSATGAGQLPVGDGTHILQSSRSIDATSSSEGFLVVHRDPITSSVSVTFVSTDGGTVRTEEVLPLSGVLQNFGTASIACGATGCLVAANTPTDVRVVELRADGSLAGAGSSVVSGTSGEVALTSVGDGFMLAVASATTLDVLTLDASGRVIAGPVVAASLAFQPRSIRIASNQIDSAAIVAGGGGPTRAVVVGMDGVPLAPASDIFLGAGTDMFGPTVATDGSDYLTLGIECNGDTTFCIECNCTVASVRLGSDGTVARSMLAYPYAHPTGRISTLVVGGMYYGIWFSENPGALVGARFGPDGLPLDSHPTVLTWRDVVEFDPAIAWNGRHFLATWHGSTLNGDCASRLDIRGNAVDPFGFRVPRYLNYDVVGSVTSRGDEWILHGRYQAEELGTVRISADGVPLDDPYNPLPITSTLSYSAASVGDTSLFAWFALDRDGLDILGGRIGAMGALMDPIPLSVSSAPGSQTFPAIGASANGFLVAWQDQRVGDDIYATLVTPTGQVGSEFAVAATSEVENGPRVVWNGESYLVLWTEGTTSGRVRGTRVDATGGLLDNPPWTLAEGDIAMDVVFDGSYYVVETLSGRYLRVAQDGRVLDEANRQPVPDEARDLASGCGRTLLVTEYFGAARGRFLDDGAPAPPGCDVPPSAPSPAPPCYDLTVPAFDPASPDHTYNEVMNCSGALPVPPVTPTDGGTAAMDATAPRDAATKVLDGGSGTSDMRASGGQGGCACDMHARDVSKQSTGYALAALMAVLAARMRRRRPASVTYLTFIALACLSCAGGVNRRTTKEAADAV